MHDGQSQDPSPFGPHRSTPQELKDQLAALRTGEAHLLYRDAEGHQVICMLTSLRPSVTIGRGECDISLSWDPEVSRVHAQLQLIGREWTVFDDGISRNGTFVNRERVHGWRRLSDRDQIRIGKTALIYRSPAQPGGDTTRPGGNVLMRGSLTEAERRMLVALCRPLMVSEQQLGQPGDGSSRATPATNHEIARELCIELSTVKNRLSALFRRFGLNELPQSEKRAQLAYMAMREGIVLPGDL